MGKYEEALERARELYNKEYYNFGKDDMAYLFPELAESEDERIIKNLQTCLHCGKTHGMVNNDEYLVCKNYLEKQKENIEKEYVFRPLAGTELTEAAEQAIRRAKEGDHLVFAFNGMYVPVRKYNSAKDLVDEYEAYLEKQKEQNVVPSRETIFGIWQLGNLWKENPEKRGGLTQLQYIQKYWFAKSDYQKDQKPSISCGHENGIEWCDNFAENIRTLLHNKLTWHSEDGGISTTVLIDDKTLKDIVSGIWFYVKQEQSESGDSEKPNNHAGWSEEDIDKIVNARARKSGTTKSEMEFYRQGIKDTLKSRCTPWKPTEEQMKALKAVLVFAGKKDSPFTIEQLHTIETLAMDLEKL